MNDFGPKRPMSEDATVSTDTVKAKRGRPKKKPDYDREKEIEARQQKVLNLFGEPFDDRVERSEAAPSIREIAKALDTTPLTVRKMLIKVHCRRQRDILQSKGKERDAGNRDESVPSGKNDSGIRGLRERPQKAGNFWRELSVPSISSDWRVLKKI